MPSQVISYGKLTMASGAGVYFEIDDPYIGQVGANGVVKDLVVSLDSLMDVVRDVAETAHSGFEAIPENMKPNEYELAFGLKICGGLGVVFANTGCEAAFQVTLKWNDKQ